MKKVTSVMLAFAMTFSVCTSSLSAYATQNDTSAYTYLLQDTEDDIAAIKQSWKKSLVGDDSNADEQYVKDYINNYVDKYNGVGGCGYAYVTFREPSGSTAPWSAGISTGSGVTHQFVSIEAMAKGYCMVGSTYYKDSETLRRIKAALKWMYDNAYNTDISLVNTAGTNEWYDWQIASPRALVNTLILLEDELESDFIQNELAAISHFVPKIYNSGSNRIYIAKILMGAALLGGDAEKLGAAIEALEEEFKYVSGEEAQGFHADGTYLYHTRHFLNGSYGAEHFELLPEIASFVKGSQYAFTPGLVSNLFEIYRNSIEPLISDGEMIAMANGRVPYDDASKAARVMKSALNLISLLDGIDEYSDECTEIKSKLKEYYSADSTHYQSLSIELFKQAYAIANDTSLPNTDDYRITKIYADGDKAVHHSKSFMTAVSMSSSRVYNYESLHDGYTKGWYLGDGMQYTYMPGDTQYDKAWRDESDPYKRPGTTVDTQERIAAKIKQGSEYLSNKDFVGGVALNNTGVAVMDLESYHNYNPNADVKLEGSVAGDSPNHTSTLTAKKAWFMFDDEVVSLGTDINANDGYEVRTIIDNRRMEQNIVYFDGNKITKEGEYASTKHLNYNDKIGYVFPDGNGENITVNSNDDYYKYIETWISHGVSPQGADYAYITLPGMTNTETAAYASSPDARVLSNTSTIQAVKDSSTATTGYVFWEAASYNGITADNACTLVVNEDSGMISMAVSDPTHKLDTITLTLENSIAVPAEIPKNVSFEIKNGNTVITVDTSDNSGKSYEFSYYTIPAGCNLNIPYVKSVVLNGTYAEYIILNPTDDPAEVSLILAVYDEEGTELKELKTKDITVAANRSYFDSLSLTASAPYMTKAFVWKGIKPLTITHDYKTPKQSE